MKRFRMEADDGKAEVLIYDVIGDDFFGEGVSAKSFAEDLKALGDVSEINVRINSPGGDTFDGLAIYNTLTRHPARIVVDIDGIAASIASVVAMAGDEIRMAENASMMIHNSSAFVIGNSADMASMAETLDKIDGQITGTYAARSGMKPEAVRALMDKETWFTAEEAKDAGLAGSVVPSKRATARFDLSQFRFQNIPEAWKSKAAASATEKPKPKPLGAEAVAARLRVLELDEQAV